MRTCASSIITNSSSISSDQRLAWYAWTDKTQCRIVQSVQGSAMNIWSSTQKMTGIPFLTGVATFIFSTAPRQTLGLIQHPPSSHSLTPWCYTSIPSYAPQYEVSWSIKTNLPLHLAKTDDITYLTWLQNARMQWTHNNIWKGNNHIISMTWCSHHKMFPPFNSTESRRHKLYQKDPKHHQNDTFSRVFLAQVGPSSYILSPHNINKKEINDKTFSSGIIKKINKKGSKRKHPSCFSCKLYCLIPNP